MEDDFGQGTTLAERRKWQDIRKGMQDRSIDHESFFAVSSLLLPLTYYIW